MAKIFGITFCPLHIPFSRRLQTGAVCIGAVFGFLGHIISCAIILVLFLSPLWPLAVGYLAWVYVFDKDISSKGGRRSDFIRNLEIWKYLSDYFPVKLVPTTTLKADKNYIFGYHPHGVIGVGAFCNFGTNATGFSRSYPGLTPHLLGLKVLFKIPLFRELMLWYGCCDVSKESILHICSREGGGNVAVILIGGAAESLDAFPGSTTLTLNNRKGFVRMALLTGASLVPVYAFGENDIFKQVDNKRRSWLRSLQNKFKKLTSFSPVLFHGRGIFQYDFGFLPFRRAINVVVGKPIAVKKLENPKMADIDKLHQVYSEQLLELYNSQKNKYSGGPKLLIS